MLSMPDEASKAIGKVFPDFERQYCRVHNIIMPGTPYTRLSGDFNPSLITKSSITHLRVRLPEIHVTH